MNMRCPNCGSKYTHLIGWEDEPLTLTKMMKSQCYDCGEEFTTEIVERDKEFENKFESEYETKFEKKYETVDLRNSVNSIHGSYLPFLREYNVKVPISTVPESSNAATISYEGTTVEDLKDEIQRLNGQVNTLTATVYDLQKEFEELKKATERSKYAYVVETL